MNSRGIDPVSMKPAIIHLSRNTVVINSIEEINWEANDNSVSQEITFL
jgi:hypothetical protein